MKIVSAVVLIILLNSAVAWLANLPQEAGQDVPKGKLNSLSFAPFRQGQSPITGNFPTPAHIEADLQLMSKKTYSIRTYASAEGSMPVIPALVRKYGLNLIQGAWLGAEEKGNQKEINALIRSANANPDVVKRVIVGNEVLLRGDLEPEELIKYIRTVKKAVKQPVSYADVWSMYMKYPELIKEVDFITIHILPYWEDEPIAVDQAPAHIARIYRHVQQEANAIAPNKSIFIGESGWPSEGRQRGWAEPSVANEAKFIRGLIKVANANGFDYNIVEAINQSWKSELEGVVGANWGLFSIDRKEVFPLTGKVYENPDWYKGLLASIGLFLIAVAVCWKPLQNLPTLSRTGLLVFLQVLTVLWVNQIELSWYTSYSDWQRLQTVVIVALNALLGGLVAQRGYGLLAGQTANPKLAIGLYANYMLLIGYAIFKTFALAINGRYIGFPIEAVTIPVIGMIGLIFIHYLAGPTKPLATFELNNLIGYVSDKTKQGKIMGYALLVAGLALIVGETYVFFDSRDLVAVHPEFSNRLGVAFNYAVTNRQLLAWLVCLIVLAVPLLVSDKKPVQLSNRIK